MAAGARERTVLPVGLDPATRGLVRELLAPITVASGAEGVAEALAFTSRLRYDGLIVAFPLFDSPLDAFLESVRKITSPCCSSGVVLVTPERFRSDADDYVDRGANRVVALEEVVHALRPAVERVVGVARRLPTKIPVRLEVITSGSARRVFCQSINASTSGMLLRIEHSWPVGTMLGLEVLIPGQSQPVCGRARVARATQGRREPFPGVGVSFSSFQHDGAKRLADYFERLRS